MSNPYTTVCSQFFLTAKCQHGVMDPDVSSWGFVFFIFLFKVQGEHSPWKSRSPSSSSSFLYVWCVSSVVIGEHLHPEVMWQFWKATGASFTHELRSFPGKSDQSSLRLSDCPAFWQTFHFSFWKFLWNKHDTKTKPVTHGMSATQAAYFCRMRLNLRD